MPAQIHELTLSNFKAFGPEPQTVPLRKINLIYGPNSGGKSSLVQALLLMKQTDEGRHGPAAFVPTGDYVDLGNFGTMVHNHATDGEIQIRLKFSPQDDPYRYDLTSYIHGNDANVPVLHRLDYVKLLTSHGRDHEVSRLELVSKSDEADVFQMPEGFDVIDSNPALVNQVIGSIRLNAERLLGNKLWRANVARGESFTSKQLRYCVDVRASTWDLIPVQAFIARGVPTQRNAREKLQKATDEIRRELRDISWAFKTAFWEQLSYLGPIQNSPQRFYRNLGGERGSVGSSGEYMFAMIASNRSESIAQINRYFARFDIKYEMEITYVKGNYESGNPVGFISLKNERGLPVTLVDVGFGISQILPTIVEGVAGSSDIVCVDQPEVHLHPRLQAQIADLLIDTCNRKHDPKQWIVETHSELLARRIQLRIAEEKITPDDVAIIYVDPVGESSVIKMLEIDEDGDWVDEWPAGFFEDGYTEMRAKDRAGG